MFGLAIVHYLAVLAIAEQNRIMVDILSVLASVMLGNCTSMVMSRANS